MKPHFTNSPLWDYKKCRCENNGDYCDYCLEIERVVDEIDEADAELNKIGISTP